MPGLSDIFGGDGGQSSETQSQSAAIEGGAVVDLGFDVGLDVGGSYQNPDGSTTTWSNSQDVSFDGEVDATFAAILSTDLEQSSFDAGA